MKNHIVTHHFGGTVSNPKASTQHHTVRTVNNHHYSLWPRFISSLGWHVGYNYVVEKDGKWTQTRALWEETAAVVGLNSSSISVAFAGNFDHGSPDTLTEAQVKAWKQIYAHIRENLPHLTDKSIDPHRKFARKSCHGWKYPNDHFRKLLAPDPISEGPNDEDKKIKELQDQVVGLQTYVMYLLSMLVRKLQTQKARLAARVAPILGGQARESCGFLPDNL